jgi:hypothetical protein
MRNRPHLSEAVTERTQRGRQDALICVADLLTPIPLDILTIERASPKNFDAGIESRQLNPAFD